MDAPSDFWEALPVDDGIFTLADIPLAKPDATTTMLSLPVEVLELIVGYCKTRSLYSLMQTNRTLYNVAVRRLYANLYIHMGYSTKRSPLKPSIILHQVTVLRALARRLQHLTSLHQLHIVKFQWPQMEEALHDLIYYILSEAVSIQHITFANCMPIPDTAYDGVVIHPSLKHVTVPNLQKSLLSAIPINAYLRSLCITSQCAPLDELQELGEKWGSSLRHFRCIIHTPEGEPELSFERIDEFASKFPHLNNLHCGYCGCDSEDEVSIESYAHVISQLPELTCIIMDNHRSFTGYRKDEERDAIDIFCQANNRLESIGFGNLSPWGDYRGIIWKSASPSLVENSRDARGETCVWTPDPFHYEGWEFWLNTFGLPAITRQAMIDRWPDATIPSMLDLVEAYCMYLLDV
ncbi:hypothetical protein CPB86DRAFT_391044 [Serendipita vermifera]|nr:hypothetical protein CPB86DRAFT_391044 [Serendipita vermifera]